MVRAGASDPELTPDGLVSQEVLSAIGNGLSTKRDGAPLTRSIFDNLLAVYSPVQRRRPTAIQDTLLPRGVCQYHILCVGPGVEYC
jgi:hypothetical protein